MIRGRNLRKGPRPKDFNFELESVFEKQNDVLLVTEF